MMRPSEGKRRRSEGKRRRESGFGVTGGRRKTREKEEGFSNHKSACLTISTCIGEDLLVEIFKRSSTKALCRFLCVSKGWKSLISSSFFVNLHHSSTNSSSTPPNLKPYLVVENKCLFGLDSFTLCHPQGNLDNRFPFQYLDNGRLFSHFKFVDVIHGVVCFSDSSFDCTVLWNPVIHKYVALPRLPVPAPFEHNAIGFGYNSSNSDFKVVRIRVPCDSINNNCSSSLLSLIYEVYSTQEGQWRMTTFDINIKCELSSIRTRTGCFMNGTIYWLLEQDNDASYIVLMFDCEGEEFTTMELPREISKGNSSADLWVYDGMLSVVMESCLNLGQGVVDCVDLWVMEEHCVTSTWNKLHSFIRSFGFISTENRNYDELMSRHEYEESMFLMDHPKVKSYTNKETVLFTK